MSYYSIYDREWPRISVDTPLTEVKRIHQLIWEYAIEHGHKPHTPYLSNCSACQYDGVSQRIPFALKCKSCPIKWPDGHSCLADASLYIQWVNESDSYKRKELAKQIRDVPFKFEKEETTDGGSENA